MRRTSLAPVLLVLSAVLGSCTPPVNADERLDATLWMQTSAEYRVAAEQAYRLAKVRLNKALEDPTWAAIIEQKNPSSHLPPAVILDVDETVLDNSPYQAQLIKEGSGFDMASWGRWVSNSQAREVPGALDFVRFARGRGVEVFFVTNRGHTLETATRTNLEKLGFPVKSAPDTLLMRGERPEWTSDKSSRRAHIAQRYRILLLIGDDLNDFVSVGRLPPEQREALATKHRSSWGTKWIILPNPLYGSWKRALQGWAHDLPASEKLKRKVEKLRGFE